MQLIEKDLKVNETKMIKLGFTRLIENILPNLRSNRKRKFNLPKNARESILRLKSLFKTKKIDIIKVDKGQMIQIIDYDRDLKLGK